MTSLILACDNNYDYTDYSSILDFCPTSPVTCSILNFDIQFDLASFVSIFCWVDFSVKYSK